ncbi:MAG: dTDP-4-dehydrorhamnose 3,5-epimerase [Bacteroidetes bacterium]|nr:dTDP-4-dehydrorhamnose 3,5-epimerase [Bacteroidota bacterium]
MNIIKTNIPDLLIIEPEIFNDERGYFFESYNTKKFKNAGIDVDFVQDNQSKSSFGVVRGLHYQLAPYSQSKLVSVIEGEVLDVAVDIRENSPTYGKWFGVILSGENKKQFLIPKGFAHGFSVLSDNAIFTYKCDNFYNKESERGIMFNDSKINIDWKINNDDAIISLKDKINPTFDKAEMNFIYGKM